MSLAGSAPMALTLVMAGLACIWLRHRPPPGWLRAVILAALAGSELVVVFWPIAMHEAALASTLPLQLSDVATLICALSLVWPRARWLLELAYLWSLPAGLLGLAFPAIGAQAPSPLFYAFYADHGTLLFYGLVLLSDQSLRLSLWSVVRAFTATATWASAAAIANLATGGDYMFLREPPPTWSPLLLMGPWPWYVVTAAGVAVLVFTALAWPKLDRRYRTGGKASPGGTASEVGSSSAGSA
ncbi:MAG: TMEM164-related integral membrane acyltransferase [Candidatus Dormibacteria bacterium]